MERSAIIIIDEDPRRKDRTAQFLARMALDVRTVGSLSALLADKHHPDMPDIAVVSLIRLTAARKDLLRRMRKAFPEVSLIALFRPEDADAGITFLRQGLIDHVAGPDNWGSIYSAVKNELARKTLLRENAAYGRNLKLLRREKARNKNEALELEEIYTATPLPSPSTARPSPGSSGSPMKAPS
jgi:DNA-binding NtrC family response regulator